MMDSSHKSPTEKKQSELVLQIPEDPSNPNALKPPISTAPEIVIKSLRPAQPETLTRRKSIPTSAFAKPKSRFEEQTTPITLQDYVRCPSLSSPSPRISREEEEAEEDEDDEDDEVFKKVQTLCARVRRRRISWLNVIECTILIINVACLLTSLLVDRYQGYAIWGLEIWKWCTMVAVICCGRLLAYWIINFLVFVIERCYLLKKKVLYFVYGLKQSVQVFLWSSFVCFTWFFVFNRGIDRSARTQKVLFLISRILVSLVIGSLIWLAKTLLVKTLASSFHMNRFFDRIQESIFHQYILQTLSGPPVMELAEKIGAPINSGNLSFHTKGKVKGRRKFGDKDVIDVSKLYKMRQEKVSAWTMKGLIHVIMSSGLSTLSSTIDESFQEVDREIISEWDAKVAAYRIFKNVAKPGCK